MLVCVAQAAISGQTLVVLHIRAALTDATGRATPLARHALLISDNPPTREPRRIVTSIDGTWERVVIDDSVSAAAEPRRFARVKVAYVAP